MIVTNLNSPELEKYAELHPCFKEAFVQMKRIMREGAEDGRKVIDGDRLFINVQSYRTKEENNCCFEAHRRYIDIQLILKGEEIIGFESADELELTKEYDPEGDYMLYALDSRYDRVRLREGEFAIIFPEEPHAPAIAADGVLSDVRKVVVKVLN